MLLHSDTSLSKPLNTDNTSNNFNSLTIAVSTPWHTFPQKADWLLENGFGLEFAPNPMKLETTKDILAPYLRQQAQVSHHAYFPGFEIGDVNKEHAVEALVLHKKAIDMMHGCGEPIITVHMGLTPEIEINPTRIVDHLTELVEHAKKYQISICLENLRFGPTSNPATVLNWAQKSGASITLDVGHANSCDKVQQGETSTLDIIDLFAEKLKVVHFYESETDRHHAPRDMTVLGPIVDKLLETNCRWWTIELNSFEEITLTRNLVKEHLSADRVAAFNPL